MADRELAKAKLRQDAIRQNATRDINAANYLLQQELTDVTTERVNAVLAKLRKHVDLLAPLDQKVCDAASDDDIADEQAKVIEFDLKLSNTITELEVRLNELKPAALQSSQGTLDTSTVATATTKHRMPELELTKFSGDPLRWDEFWDDFSCSVDERTDISVIDKFKLLKQCLLGEAANLADGYYLTVANYSHVKDELKSRFGDPEVGISAHLEALLELEPATLETASLVNVRDKCEAHVRSLIALGLDESSFGRIYAPIILSKLPKLVKMDMNRRNGAKAWTLAALREALKDEILLRTKSEQSMGADEDEPDQMQTPKAEPWKKHISSASALLTQGHDPQPRKGNFSPKPRTCVFCSSPDHRNWNCNVYPDIMSRQDKVRGRCTVCFKAAHQKTDCRSSICCYYCQSRDHNSSLCPTQFSENSTDQQHAESRGMPPANATIVQANKVVKPSAPTFLSANVNAVHGHNAPGGGPKQIRRAGKAIMETAKVRVIGQKSSCTARAVFDTGSTMSFIKSKLVRKIGANPVGYDYRALGKFGDSTRSDTRYSTFEFGLELNDGSYLQLEMNAVEHASTPLTLVPLDVDDCLEHCSESELAEMMVDQPTEVEIDILIGLDYYHKFMGDQQWRLKSGLVLKESKVGYIVTGYTGCPTIRQPKPTDHQLLVISSDSRYAKCPKATAEHAALPVRYLMAVSEHNEAPHQQKRPTLNGNHISEFVPGSHGRSRHATRLEGSRCLTFASGGHHMRHYASRTVESMGVNDPRLTPCVRPCSTIPIRSRTFFSSTFRLRPQSPTAGHPGSKSRNVCKVDESTGAHDPLLPPSVLARDYNSTFCQSHTYPTPVGCRATWAVYNQRL